MQEKRPEDIKLRRGFKLGSRRRLLILSPYQIFNNDYYVDNKLIITYYLLPLIRGYIFQAEYLVLIILSLPHLFKNIFPSLSCHFFIV